MPKNQPKKAFVWYSLRIAFWIMIFFWVLAATVDITKQYILTIIWVAITIFTFVVSIIHLNKYNKKSFAVVSLIFSSLLILLFLIGLGAGIGSTPSSNLYYNETNKILENGYFQSFEIQANDYDYLNLNFSSNNPINFYLLDENEFLRYKNSEQFYYIKYSESIKENSFENTPLSPGIYHIVLESVDSSATYNLTAEINKQ